MATIEKRGQFWRVKVRRAGLPAQTKTFDNRTHAQQWARSVESDLDKGIVVDRRTAQRLSLAEVLERYRLEVTPTKPGSLDENLRLKAMAQRPFARIRMSALTSSLLAAYRDERLKLVSGATVNREFSVLSHAIDTARREWDVYLPTNPCGLVRRPPQGHARNRRLQGDEEQRLLAACRNARNVWLAHFVALAIETGMRRGELLGLLWDNVDLERRTAFLPVTKNGESRGVPLSSRAVAVLRGLPASSSGRVFGELTPLAVRLSFNRATRRAGITGLRLHDLRHEATSRFFEKGLNVMEVASVTGHKTLQMLKRYTHLSVTDLATRLG
ncbi:MAG TPA: site-specific integrase [Gemmatimonadales bacterium]|nr:site-specific integrase [Gemmatimonadales bacterium]